ncbi:hypothetical protein [Chryseobacterium nepalense]|uniref:Uncharacterized protein n=1 Tax=Chryseobacterium nepalense TaxID=1854498 RepID=A0ABY4KBG6_9FLAO|nr:hypothetical protein [Chryseobacterium nepalense]UPQ76852.1 hypothetical protein M0D58_04700 [Chryseobacterium nepalense]
MKIKLKLVILGNVPIEFKTKTLIKWKSELFDVEKTIDKYSINYNSDSKDWEYSDQNIENQLPDNFNGDILFAITNVPLQDNYYSRRLSNNRICITFCDMAKLLKNENIPIENLILRLLYAYSFAYLSHNKNLPTSIEFRSFTHDETKGCLFDMNGIKEEVIFSTNNPIICNSCIEKLKVSKVPENLIQKSQNEIKKINKILYYRIFDFIKQYPLLSLLLSAIFAIALGIIGSLIASFIWEKL